MRRIDGIVGNRHEDPALDERLTAHDEAGSLERVVLESADRKKSRLRVETDAGTDLGILVDRPELRAGDVLFCEEDRAAVVEFDAREAYVITVPDSGADAVAAAVELGHRIGNQHWDIAVEDGAVYVPVEADKAIVEAVLCESLPEGASTRYETVDATLFIDSTDDHEREGSHPAGHGGGHSHADDHGHSHGGGHGHSHGTSHDHSREESHSHDLDPESSDE